MDQRRAQRYRLRLPVHVTNVGSASVSREGETLDISSSGVLFKSTDELQPGERIEFVITLSTSIPEVRLRCLGKVTRSDRQDGESYFDIAVTIDRYNFIRSPQMEAAAVIA